GEVARANGVVGGVAAGGVRQQLDAGRVDVREDRLGALRLEVVTAHRDGDEFGAGGLMALLHHLERGGLARADDEARLKGLACEREGLAVHYPPPTNVTISI